MILFLILIGLVIGINLRWNYLLLIPLLFLYLLFIFIKYKKKVLFFVAITSFIGVAISYIHIENNKETYHGMVIESKTNYFIFLSEFDKYYVSNYSNQYEIGDFLEIKGRKEEVNFITLESEFDFNDYLNKKGINYSINTSYIKEKFLSPLRINKYKNNFLARFDDETSSLIGSLLFSITNYDSLIYKNASRLHLLRLTSASGIYIYLYLKMVQSILKIKFDDKEAEMGSIIFLIPYLIFTFPRFSVIRILTLSLSRWINKYKLNKRIDNISLISLNALFFLFLDNNLARQDSFLLGYSIPIFMYFINDLKTTKKQIINRLLSSFYLFLFFIPFEISYFNEINLFSFLYQILLSPLFSLFGGLSFLSFLHLPLYKVLNYLSKLISFILLLLVRINPSIYMKNMNPLITLIYYLLLFGFLYYRSIGFRHFKRVFMISELTLSCLLIIPINNFITTEVSFINVGQGDSCLIRSQNKTVLIDTGGSVSKDIATEVLIPYFKSKQIYKIDLLITTHDDFDHSGAKDSLFNNFKVASFIYDPFSFPLSIGNIKLNNYNYLINQNEENDNSLVIGFNLSNVDYLIMGDASKKVEKEIMNSYSNIKCDILKVGHHGSNTSTSEQFLTYLSPKEAIISCGINNKYHHPNDEVIRLLNKYHIKIRRTDYEGTISYINYISM